MTAFVLPAPDAPGEEWGRLAVSLPGWRWMPGMLVPYRGYYGRLDDDDVSGHPLYTLPLRDHTDTWPDPDDPATAGCLLALLGPTPSEGYMAHVLPPSSAVTKWRIHMNTARTGAISAYGWSLGRACIAAAAALGRWPGGEE